MNDPGSIRMAKFDNSNSSLSNEFMAPGGGNFDINEETALLLDDIDNPYQDLVPENFTLEQKI